jgi:hypothetical protein
MSSQTLSKNSISGFYTLQTSQTCTLPSKTAMATSETPPKTTFADNVETYQAAINSLFSGSPDSTEADLSKLFTPTFTQRDGDSTRDFPAFVKHIRWLREILPKGGVNVKVTHFMREGNQIAERHSGDPVTLPDGREQWGETFMWVEIAADGRIEWIVETVKRQVREKCGKWEAI